MLANSTGSAARAIPIAGSAAGCRSTITPSAIFGLTTRRLWTTPYPDAGSTDSAAVGVGGLPDAPVSGRQGIGPK